MAARPLTTLGHIEVNSVRPHALTALPDRSALVEQLHRALASAVQERSPVALLLIDLNRFKDVNHTLGHHAGDRILQEVGTRIQQTLRAFDTLARLGGDEFAVLLPSMDSVGATRAARRILATLDMPCMLEDHSIDIGASIGIALFPEHGKDATALLRQADVAMYVAKNTGGGYAVYNADQDQNSPLRLALASELRRALAAEQLFVQYQPLVDIPKGRVARTEALLRWQHPVHGMVPPDQFIPLAEHTGLIGLLTLWILEETLREVQRWLNMGRSLGVAVNLSMRTLHDAQFPETVAWLLRRYGIAPNLLTLEITESVLMADPARAMSVLTHLARIGVRIAIDDFGTGYSSLGYLKRLPVDEIKIDRSFVLGMGADAKDTAIVRSVIELAHNLDLSVVAEGVETQETLDLLAAWGCDVAQGYYLSRPVIAADLLAWLERTNWSTVTAPLIDTP